LLPLLLASAVFPAAQQSAERVIYTSVVTRSGEPVLDLTAKDFIVRRTARRRVLRVERDTDPLQITLLVDNSAAMRGGSPHPQSRGGVRQRDS
jgi:hypothetical protein